MPMNGSPSGWDQLKPVIYELYINQGLTAKEVLARLKKDHAFNANEHSFKYYIRKWKFKKSFPEKARKRGFSLIESRGAMGQLTMIQYRGQVVDNEKLIRHAAQSFDKTMIRQRSGFGSADRSLNEFRPPLKKSLALFSKWNMPYGAMRHAQFDILDHIESPCSGLVALTPRSPANSTLMNETFTVMCKQNFAKQALDRAHLLMGGFYNDLISSMPKRDQIVASTWLYQFWLFAYQTVHNWGRGPRNWNKDLLEFNKFAETLSWSAAPTPASTAGTPRSMSSPAFITGTDIIPTNLCNWSVHAQRIEYQAIREAEIVVDDSPENSLREGQDWPTGWMLESNLSDKLREGLSNNLFSDIPESILPVAIPSLLRSAELPRSELLSEALNFSIIGANTEVVLDILDEIEESDAAVKDVYPFHLAISYLSGSGACCKVLEALAMGSRFEMKSHNVDTDGHTILDNIMIAILKSHTDCNPGDVNDKLAHRKRFDGEDLDVCGRWNPASDVWRSLLARGEVRVPFQWKHKFCHTSTQAICHCITIIFGKSWSPNINGRSGLFRKACQSCNHISRLLPIHTVVMTTFWLAEKGREDEDLFGMIACLLCLLRKGADPKMQAEISVASLFQQPFDIGCTHRRLNASQLAEQIPGERVQQWSETTKNGWRLFRYILDTAAGCYIPAMPPLQTHEGARAGTYATPAPFDELAWPQDPFATPGWVMDDAPITDINFAEGSDDFEEEREYCGLCDESTHLIENVNLRDLWVGVQAEFLTYRRLHVEDPWLSERFNIEQILSEIDSQRKVSVGFLDQNLLKKACACGVFVEAANPEIPCLTEVCNSYITNMEMWERTTYLTSVEIIDDWGYAEEVMDSDDEKDEHD